MRLVETWRMRPQYFSLMYCPDKLKLNKFKKVAIPSVRDLFRNSGLLNMPSNVYTGEEPAPVGSQRKLDEILEAYEMNKDLLNAEDMERERLQHESK